MHQPRSRRTLGNERNDDWALSFEKSYHTPISGLGHKKSKQSILIALNFLNEISRTYTAAGAVRIWIRPRSN